MCSKCGPGYFTLVDGLCEYCRPYTPTPAEDAQYRAACVRMHEDMVSQALPVLTAMAQRITQREIEALKQEEEKKTTPGPTPRTDYKTHEATAIASVWRADPPRWHELRDLADAYEDAKSHDFATRFTAVQKVQLMAIFERVAADYDQRGVPDIGGVLRDESKYLRLLLLHNDVAALERVERRLQLDLEYAQSRRKESQAVIDALKEDCPVLSDAAAAMARGCSFPLSHLNCQGCTN